MKHYFALWLIVTAIAFPTNTGLAQEAANHCQVQPSRSDAIDWPSKHAWNLFVWLNHPAIDERVRRGVPDCRKPVGAPGTTAVWETWRNAATEVFLEHEPPEWNDVSLPDERPGTVPKRRDTAKGMGARALAPDLEPPMISFHQQTGAVGPVPMFSPDDGVFSGNGGFGETRLNKATYEFIRNECVYNRQGTERYAQAIVDKKKEPISLPVDSIEVKAAWIDFEREKTPLERRATYYTANYQGKQYGLAALHILTKDIPNWFWASFHHVDAPENDWEIPDTFGRPKVLAGTVWENYVLGGAQIDFVTPTGKPTILSDHYVEFGFQKSSCITCHATATIATTSAPRRVGMPAGQSRAVCLLDPNQPPFSEPAVCKRWAGEHLFKPGTDELVEERGAPLPEWWFKDGKEAYFQTDFLYSIPFRAGQVEEKGTPPDRCRW